MNILTINLHKGRLVELINFLILCLLFKIHTLVQNIAPIDHANLTNKHILILIS